MYDKSARWYDAIYSFKDYAAEAVILRGLIESRRGSPGGALLDVACGTGEHLRHLRAYFTVEGIDINESMLAVAREKLPGVRLRQGDMLDFDLGERYDAVLCLFSAVGYLRNEAELERSVRNMGNHLNPDGVLVVEPWILPEAFVAGRVHSLFVDRPDLKLARINVSRVEGRAAVMDMHHLIGTEQGIDYFVERHELTLFTDDEYRGAFIAAGLAVEPVPNGLAGRGLYLGRPV
ncbi:MAG TPA: class I SAM-dependent methyltransferase [Anaerolineales bacterium]|nr:class I SAM-dependent methyltransferase [Anaerolineales bacterium]